jgi:hypothetical protein
MAYPDATVAATAEPVGAATRIAGGIAAMRMAGLARDRRFLGTLDSVRRDAGHAGFTTVSAVACACEDAAGRVAGRLSPQAAMCWCEALGEALAVDRDAATGLRPLAHRAGEALLANVALRLRG